MKRSIILDDLQEFINNNSGCLTSEDVLTFLEQLGMKPPAIKASKFRPTNYPWGSCCSMRCCCDECNPNFLVYHWEY